jgi:hypothetical protein
MKFYGMSSASAMDKHAGGVAEYRASKAKPCCCPTAVRWRTRCATSWAGALHLHLCGCQPAERARKRTTFIRVREQKNNVYGKGKFLLRPRPTVRSQPTGVLPCAPVFSSGIPRHDKPSPPFDWDIFCCVVDNFGDIGVTWRLARQLKQEGALPAQKSEVQVRLWVDDLASFARICPALDPAQDGQWVDGIYVQHWHERLPADMTPARVVIEAFACELSVAFYRTHGRADHAPLLDQPRIPLAESWVEDCLPRPSRSAAGA